jgi:hypothetical protein
MSARTHGGNLTVAGRGHFRFIRYLGRYLDGNSKHRASLPNNQIAHDKSTGAGQEVAWMWLDYARNSLETQLMSRSQLVSARTGDTSKIPKGAAWDLKL